MAMATVFIDGQAGTTGLEIAERLSTRDDLHVLTIDPAQRKDLSARQQLLQSADVAILCLPDEAARESVTLAAGQTRLLDASTAHRVDPEWTYGLAELNADQPAKITQAQYVSNPGCYPQGFILLIRPLIEAGVLSVDVPLRCHALSGYSGGGRQMVETYQGFDAAQAEALNTRDYALHLNHKHVPEMQYYSGTRARPLFNPMVANYLKGMLVHVPLFCEQELNGTSARELHAILAERYRGQDFVHVRPFEEQPTLDGGFLEPTSLNNTNDLELLVFGNDEQVLLVARYDNLGKGASGAAVQNLNLMLNIDQTKGL